MILLDPSARPIIAHRGASGKCPENTVFAFEQGLASGADAFEFDVRMSSDGIPVVIHDATVDRTTNGRGAVRNFSARDLAGLDAGARQGVPTVDTVLETFPEVPLIIELKEPEAAFPLAQVVERHAASARVLVGSFLHTALSRINRTAICRSASRQETAVFWLSSRIRLAPCCRRYDALTVPVRTGRLHIVDGRFVETAYRKSMPVHVWTVDDRAEAEHLRSLGVSGIITNWPERMVGLGRS